MLNILSNSMESSIPTGMCCLTIWTTIAKNMKNSLGGQVKAVILPYHFVVKSTHVEMLQFMFCDYIISFGVVVSISLVLRSYPCSGPNFKVFIY